MIKNVLMQVQVLHAELNCKTYLYWPGWSDSLAAPTFEVHGEEVAEQSMTHIDT